MNKKNFSKSAPKCAQKYPKNTQKRNKKSINLTAFSFKVSSLIKGGGDFDH